MDPRIYMLLSFLLTPVVTIPLLFVRDQDEKRKKRLNNWLIGNLIVFLLPLLHTLFFGDWTWDDSWYLYFILIPICDIVLLSLFLKKMKYRREDY